MTNEAGSSTTAGTGSPGSRPVRDPAGLTAPAAIVLALLTLGWLAAMIWSARAQLRGAEFAEIAITVAANAVPVLAQGALVAGLGAGLLGEQPARTARPHDASTRFLAATGAGLLVGTVAALTVHFTYYSGTANMVLAGTTVAAATIGGAVAGFLLTPAAGAVAAGTLTAYLMVLVLSLFTDNLRSLFGAGETQESQVAAAQWVSRTSSLAAGLAAGLVVFAYLRWSLRRARSATAGPSGCRRTCWRAPATGPAPADRRGDHPVRWPRASSTSPAASARPTASCSAHRRLPLGPRDHRALRRGAHRRHRLRPHARARAGTPRTRHRRRAAVSR